MYSNSSFVQEVNGHLNTYEEFLKSTAQELDGSNPSSLSLSPQQELQHSHYKNHNLSHDLLKEARYLIYYNQNSFIEIGGQNDQNL